MTEYPYLSFTFKGRIKSLIRSEAKFNGYIVEYIYDYYTKKGEFPTVSEIKTRLNCFRDLIAYRIVISMPRCHLEHLEVQLRTKDMDDVAEIGTANHLGYEKKQEYERARRDAIPKGECIYFDEAFERGIQLQQLDLSKLDVNMFKAADNSLINDGCGLYRGRWILPYEHLSRFQNDLID